MSSTHEHGRRYVAAALVTLGIAYGQAYAAGDHWVATWGTAQQLVRLPPTGGNRVASAAPTTAPAQAAPAPGIPRRRFGIPPPLSGLTNQTVRMIVRASIGGRTIRVRLSNAFGASPVLLGAAHVAVRASESAIVAGTDRTLTFSGRASATLYAGQVIVSDPVGLDVRPLSDLAVSLYFPQETGAPTSHTFGLRPAYVSKEGDFTGAAHIADPDTPLQSYFWLAGVDVRAPDDAGTLVTFGDSITDGDQSTPDTNQMWPALLAGRLQRHKATAHIGVVNAGIAGNRILGDNNSGVARFISHALAVPGVRWITVLEGINDVTAATRPGAAPSTFSADDLIAAYRQLIDTAHLHGVKVIGCTLTPYGGSAVYTDRGEAIRQAANAWIRTSGAFDAVIDFDAATRDPNQPSRFRAEADSPDMLHPGDSGYKLMADAIDLSVFRTRGGQGRKAK
jgi:lysophospholipase L1-like esterase